MSAAALPSNPLQELDDYLGSERSPENCMAVSDLDGFLAAIAVGPGLIAPARWLPVVWGGETPRFADAAEEARIVGAIMGRYNEILQLMASDPEAYEPIFGRRRRATPWSATGARASPTPCGSRRRNGRS